MELKSVIKSRKTAAFITEAIISPRENPTIGAQRRITTALVSPVQQAIPENKAQTPNKQFTKPIQGTPDRNYYENLELKPGFKFYQSLCRLSQPIQKYGLRIPQTYYAEEQKLLVYDYSKDCIVRAEPMGTTQFKLMLEAELRDNILKGIDAQSDEGKNLLNQPAYIVRKRINIQDDKTTSVFYYFSD